MKRALLEVGSPVFAAALTTLGAALFLLGCIMVPFVKIGTVLSLNTSFSCVASLIFMPCLLFVMTSLSEAWRRIEWRPLVRSTTQLLSTDSFHVDNPVHPEPGTEMMPRENAAEAPAPANAVAEAPAPPNPSAVEAPAPASPPV